MNQTEWAGVKCPKCGVAVAGATCVCGNTIETSDGVADLFSDLAVAEQYRRIGEFYDTLYQETVHTWEQIASRGDAFTQFMATMIAASSPRVILDMGCGKGNLLAAVSAAKKYGIDLSAKALRDGAKRCNAFLCTGIAEDLPFIDCWFDAVSCIGVLTHLLDQQIALAEVSRVLKPGGHFYVGIYVRPSVREVVASKFAEFTHPRLQPVRFVSWTARRMLRPFKKPKHVEEKRDYRQPVEKTFTPNQLDRMFSQAGFVVNRLVTKWTNPEVPLVGPHFRIYVLQKPQTAHC